MVTRQVGAGGQMAARKKSDGKRNELIVFHLPLAEMVLYPNSKKIWWSSPELLHEIHGFGACSTIFSKSLVELLKVELYGEKVILGSGAAWSSTKYTLNNLIPQRENIK
jgi:hypothetical protein